MGRKDASGHSDGSVKKASLVVALLGIVIAAACLAAVFLLPDRIDAKSELVFEPLLLLASLLLLVAYCASSHLLFLPFLVINVVIIVLKILYIATAAYILEKRYRDEDFADKKARIVPTIILVIVTLIFNVVAQLVVTTVFKHVKQDATHAKKSHPSRGHERV
ncbi:hypothetical protein AAVH_32358 [Aphelenchoides avenae]|nr:hypothetical protein AAVH_32358 [Aphelenchus avenae]